ncbi:MAG: polysaccharide biosynthesis tyrosine autokinase [Myxococcota bacterium]|jgi:capsular exopolysaccharide synthesis family protein|nr:polysaccharide biosynthesis tyrosine autokinase [Myxococcota bacterium]
MSNDLYISDGPAVPQKQEDDGPSLTQIMSYVFGLLRKYFWIFILTCAATTSAAYFWTERQPRVYRAQAKLIFHESQNNIFGRQIERVDLMDPGGRWQFEQFWRTQKEILDSTEFATRVARRGDFLGREGFVPTTGKDGKELGEDRRLELAAAKILSSTTLNLTTNSRVVNVNSTTVNDPELAQEIANAYAKAYIDYTREFQSGGLNQMISWFDDYVANKRDELGKAQNKLLQYKRDKGILSISYEDRMGLTGSNMELINQQLNAVKAKLAAEEALLSQIRDMEKRGEDMRNLAAFIDQSGSLSNAIQRQTLLREKVAQLQGRGYLGENPEIKAAKSELDLIDKHIAEEIDRIKSGIKNRAATSRRERSRLEAELKTLRSEAFELDAVGVEYGQLKDNAENLKELFQTVLKRSEELDINSLYESNNVQILEEARKPSAPISPNMTLNLLIGLALGLGLGSAILALIYLLDNTVRSEHDITRYTDRPVLGTLPAVDSNMIKDLTQGQDNPLDLITHIAPRSTFAEGIKSLRTNLMFMAPDNPPKLLMVTSPGPGEGKTLISTNMAVAMAQSGLKTLLIDADMRRPRVHKALGMENDTHGLVSLLEKREKVADVVRETPVENLHVLTCGEIPPNPAELLHAESLPGIIDELLTMYDRVIFDSPPLGAVSDALVLSHFVESVILITKFGQTRRELLKRSIEQLVTIGAPLMGCVLNNIDTSVGGYGYYNYYYYYRYDEQPESKPKRKKRGEAA